MGKNFHVKGSDKGLTLETPALFTFSGGNCFIPKFLYVYGRLIYQ